ncbi:MAG: 2-phospho-L-lactate guanylyltransferase [Acidimicrobiia bacterium]|nr:2-phospho-L-lactate guanylyltransferase [Acidimicrobiia bacterium]
MRTPGHAGSAAVEVQSLAVRAAVLVPVKRFTAAKGRLSGVLTNAERARLARWMATGVLEAVAALPTFVACDDEEVGEWAVSHGASVLWGPGLGLNGAVDDGIGRISAAGHDHIIVTHADLPRPWRLPDMASNGRITIVPDTIRDGTNVMSFPTGTPIDASYGGRSFSRHLAQAEASAQQVDVVDDSDLSLDVDTPDDLAHPLVREVLPEWVRTNRGSRHSA